MLRVLQLIQKIWIIHHRRTSLVPVTSSTSRMDLLKMKPKSPSQRVRLIAKDLKKYLRYRINSRRKALMTKKIQKNKYLKVQQKKRLIRIRGHQLSPLLSRSKMMITKWIIIIQN